MLCQFAHIERGSACAHGKLQRIKIAQRRRSQRWLDARVSAETTLGGRLSKLLTASSRTSDRERGSPRPDTSVRGEEVVVRSDWERLIPRSPEASASGDEMAVGVATAAWPSVPCMLPIDEKRRISAAPFVVGFAAARKRVRTMEVTPHSRSDVDTSGENGNSDIVTERRRSVKAPGADLSCNGVQWDGQPSDECGSG